jgi:uncharacterized membrane protein
MNIEAVSHWLRDTIPGIIVLGALGSFAAGLVLWSAKRLLAPVSAICKALFMRVGFALTTPIADRYVEVHFKKDENRFLVHFTLQIMKLIWSLFFAALCFIVFIAGLTQSTASLLRPQIFVSVVLFFLFLWKALRAFVAVAVPDQVDFERVLNKKQAEKELLEKQ